MTEYFGNGITHRETHLGQKLGPVPPQPLQSLQEEGGFTKSQEASNVGGCQGHHLTVLVEKLEEQERRSQVLLNIQILLVWTEQLSKAQAHPSTVLRGVCASKKNPKKPSGVQRLRAPHKRFQPQSADEVPGSQRLHKLCSIITNILPSGTKLNICCPPS